MSGESLWLLCSGGRRKNQWREVWPFEPMLLQQVYHPNSAEVVILGFLHSCFAVARVCSCIVLTFNIVMVHRVHVALCARGAPLKGLIVLQVGFEWSFDAWEDTRYTDHDRTVNIRPAPSLRS